MLYIINTFLRDQNNLVIPKKRKKNSKKNIFFIIHTKIFTTRKILKMENKHPEHYWSAWNSLLENKKKIDFWNTLNHFFFVKFIPWIYDVVHYKHFLRDQNNIVIPKKRKKNSKKNIFFIIHTKIFTTRKILKMENKHPEHYWSA
jgi:5-formaminoimidazole-4-carboxamide-1-beta-D-ribofuranosyl 5'-monophosphate synthetase